MNATILQVPISKSLRDEAVIAAREQGFSSLQEIVRVMLAKLASKQLAISITEEPVVRLSKRAEKRYAKMDKDFKEGKNVFTANSVEELMQQLAGKS